MDENSEPMTAAEVNLRLEEAINGLNRRIQAIGGFQDAIDALAKRLADIEQRLGRYGRIP